MLGVKRRSNGPSTWVQLNARTGALVESKNTGEVGEDGKAKYEKVSHEGLSDVLIKRVFATKDVYEGQEKDQINISTVDSEGHAVVIKSSINQLSIKLLGCLNAIDLTKPIDIKGYLFEKGSDTKLKDTVEGSPTFGQYVVEAKREKDESQIVVDQPGAAKVRITPDFGGKGVQFPKTEKIGVTNPKTNQPVIDPKTKQPAYIVDSTDRDAAILAFITTLDAKVQAVVKNQPAVAPTAPVEPHDEDGIDPEDLVTGGQRPEHA